MAVMVQMEMEEFIEMKNQLNEIKEILTRISANSSAAIDKKTTVNEYKLYSLPEVAKLIGVSERTLRRDYKEGLLVPSVGGEGKQVRFTLNDIRNYTKNRG
jgi:DNA-binding transcriptional regulator YhcF (GntR family)